MAYYSSLFKKEDVRITQKYSSSHRGLDLSRGVVRSPIYFPNKAISGEVVSIISEYDYLGVHYKNAPIILIKHKNGSGSRYIHSYPQDVKVKVGDKVVAGQQICCTGNAGHSFGDHLHFEWLSNWNDLRTRIDPFNFVINDNMQTFKIGDKIKFTGVQHIREGSGIKYKVLRDSIVGEIATIKDGVRVADGYNWYDCIFSNGSTGWVADVKKFVLDDTTVQDPVIPPEQTECEKEVERLKIENRGLSDQLGGLKSQVEGLGNELELQKDRVAFLEASIKEREDEIKELQASFDTLKIERDRIEKEKLDLQEDFDKYKQENEKNCFIQIFDKIIDFIKKRVIK